MPCAKLAHAIIATILLALVACTSDTPAPGGEPEMIARAPFGNTPDGQQVELFTMSNRNGIELRAMTYGAVIVSLRTPDRDGQLDDIVLGFDSLASYTTVRGYFGPVVGRYGNRIAQGQFTLDSVTYTLAKNNGPNHLHGGVRGFNKMVWRGEPFQRGDSVGVTFRYTSPDGEEGYPGTLETAVTYTLTDANELIIDYHATTDKPTVVNLTQHSFFNLAGIAKGDVLGHELMINASAFTPVDAGMIPTGEIRSVEGTPFDFRQATAIGARIDTIDEQISYGPGYDHNFVLDRVGTGLELAARVTEPMTGRTLEVRTTEPGIQFYAGNKLDGTIIGKGGHPFVKRGGFCLETQHFPDSPNQPSFPSTVLRPGNEYRSRTVFAFGVTE